MSRSGPLPTPTKLKILRGNPGKRRLPRDEPKPAPTTPDPPADLTAGALSTWHEHAPELARLGLLTVVDRRRLATACRMQALGDAYGTTAEEQLGTGGRKARPSPALWAAVKCWEKAGAIWDRFGITPAERVHLTVPPPRARESKWDGLLSR